MSDGERTVPSITCQENQIPNWILISHKSEKQLKTAKSLNPEHETAKLLEENLEDNHHDIDVGNEVWTRSISRDRQITNGLAGFNNLKQKGKQWKERGKRASRERRKSWEKVLLTWLQSCLSHVGMARSSWAHDGKWWQSMQKQSLKTAPLFCQLQAEVPPLRRPPTEIS